ncbi:MAG: O-antigen ligase family protein [Microbacteriaceae bacterium]|nr:O-antigen ligase family protein [Microbacteriaceae bacterium]
MTRPAHVESPPTATPAHAHVAVGDRRGIDAVTVLTVYFVLLFAIPSSMFFTSMNSLGRPSMLFGLGLMFWWLLGQLQRSAPPVHRVHQPVRVLVFAVLAVALLSYGAALLRGQPADQTSPAMVSVLDLVSLAGVLLVAMDGITSLERFRALAGRLVTAGALMAALGLVQFATGRVFVDMIAIPGMSNDTSEVGGRADFIRATATASHPLEYAAVLSVCLPVAIALALDPVLSATRRHLSWCAVAVIATAAALSVSRSALLGVAIGIVFILPALPSAVRRAFAVGAIALAGALAVLVPGMLSTIVAMFSGISSDSSAQSRSAGIPAGLHFIGHSPIFGIGYGTFLPRYYIFDNQWMGIAIQLGVVGLAAFAGLFGTGAWSAFSARLGVHADEGARVYGQALVAGILAIAMLCASFDALSFPQAASLCFLLPGMAAALRRLYRGDAPPIVWRHEDTRALERYLRSGG